MVIRGQECGCQWFWWIEGNQNEVRMLLLLELDLIMSTKDKFVSTSLTIPEGLLSAHRVSSVDNIMPRPLLKHIKSPEGKAQPEGDHK